MASYRYISCPISTSNVTLKTERIAPRFFERHNQTSNDPTISVAKKNSFKGFSQAHKQIKRLKPKFIHTVQFKQCIEKAVSKTYWNSGKMHCYHLVTTKTNHEHKPPQYYFAYSVVMRGCSIIFPRILDWQQLLQHSCRWDSHPAKDKEKESEKKNNHGYIVFVPNGSLVPIFYFNLLFN